MQEREVADRKWRLRLQDEEGRRTGVQREEISVHEIDQWAEFVLYREFLGGFDDTRAMDEFFDAVSEYEFIDG